MMDRKQLSMSVLATLIAMTISLVYIYIYAAVVRQLGTPFSMTSNHIQLTSTKDVNVSFSEIINVNEDRDVLALSFDADSEFAGVYDPENILAFENALIAPGHSRYFSSEDYLTGSQTGVLISDNIFAAGLPQNSHIENLLYVADRESSISNYGQFNEIINLAAVGFGNVVYIDYSDQDAAQRIVERLEDAGYRIGQQDSIGLMSILLQMDNPLILILSSGGLALYVLFAIVAYWTILNQRKAMAVHHLHGGRIKTTIPAFAKQFLVCSLIGFIPFLGTILYVTRGGYLIMPFYEMTVLYLIHYAAVGLIYTGVYSLAFAGVSRGERGDRYVH